MQKSGVLVGAMIPWNGSGTLAASIKRLDSALSPIAVMATQGTDKRKPASTHAWANSSFSLKTHSQGESLVRLFV